MPSWTEAQERALQKLLADKAQSEQSWKDDVDSILRTRTTTGSIREFIIGNGQALRDLTEKHFLLSGAPVIVDAPLAPNRRVDGDMTRPWQILSGVDD